MPFCEFSNNLVLSLPHDFSQSHHLLRLSALAAVLSLPFYMSALQIRSSKQRVRNLITGKTIKNSFPAECHRGVVSEHRPSLFLAERRAR
jgi:hypothetical protein